VTQRSGKKFADEVAIAPTAMNATVPEVQAMAKGALDQSGADAMPIIGTEAMLTRTISDVSRKPAARPITVTGEDSVPKTRTACG